MKRRIAFALVVCVAVMHAGAFACPSCYGDPGSTEVKGMKWAIISLLGITGTVLGGVGAFFLYLRKRALELNRQFADRLN